MNTYKSITFGVLGITAMLASCSQDEILQSPTAGKNLVTVTAALPEGIQTRSEATSNEKNAITRCKLAIYKVEGDAETHINTLEDTTPEDGFTFSFEVDDAESQYNYYCWADDGTSYTIANDDLSSISVSSEFPAIAQRGEALGKKLSDGNVTVPMNHAVAKISLKVTALTHKAYNAVTGKVTDGRVAIEKSVVNASVAGATDTDPQEVFFFYALVDTDEANQTVSVEYNSAKEDIANVPVKADWCTTLKGDITQVGLVDYTVTATIDSDWENANAYYPEVETVNAETHTITTTKGGEIADNTVWISEAMNGQATLNIVGIINDEDIAAIKAYLTENSGMELDLNLAKAEMTALPGNNISYTPTAGYKEWPGLKSIILPERLTTIGMNAFQFCSDLTSVTLPSTLESIENYAFCYCTGLKEISLPTSLKVFGYGAFGHSGLTSIDLSNTQVELISNGAFLGCTGLEEIVFGNSVKRISRDAFGNCNSLTTIDLSLCDQIPTEGFTINEWQYTFSDVSSEVKAAITIYVKNNDMITEFGTTYWVTHEGFTTANCKVK